MDVFAPMIAIQLADFFLLKRNHENRAVFFLNLAVWLVGFVGYRLLMKVDWPVGYTVPDMALTMLLCVVTGKLFGGRHAKS